jgi:hypothetical protein
MKAMQFASEISEYVKKYEGLSDIRVYFDCFGDSGNIRWFVDYEDLATLEKVQSQVLADQEYWQKLEKNKDLFIVDSIKDVAMRSV